MGLESYKGNKSIDKVKTGDRQGMICARLRAPGGQSRWGQLFRFSHVPVGNLAITLHSSDGLLW